MSGLEIIFGQDGKLNINQCCKIAKDLSVENKGCSFNLCGPLKSLPSKWLDPYFGMFEIDGSDGFLMMSDFEFANVWCTDVLPIEE